MPSTLTRYYIDVHDFGYLLPGMDDMTRLKKIYPDFKITAFTIPFPKQFFIQQNQDLFKIARYKKWAEIINSYEWLEIGLHGFAHTHNEMTKSYDKVITLLEASENLFAEIGLEYKKIFCAPFWQYSYDALVALRDKGYTVAIDRNHVREVPEGTKTYIYNWSLEEPLPDEDKIIGHGHVGHSRNVKNNLDSVYRHLITNIPVDSKFGFVSSDCVTRKEQHNDSEQEHTMQNSGRADQSHSEIRQGK